MNDDIIITPEEEIFDTPESDLPKPEENKDFLADDKNTSECSEDSNAENIEDIKSELEKLRREFSEKQAAFERMSREMGEFSEAFPETNISSVPDSVWESVRAGIPLAAAYALYERKAALRLAVAQSINKKNSESSTGSVGRETNENFFTPDEVRAMSRADVKANYQKILESMKKWN